MAEQLRRQIGWRARDEGEISCGQFRIQIERAIRTGADQRRQRVAHVDDVFVEPREACARQRHLHFRLAQFDLRIEACVDALLRQIENALPLLQRLSADFAERLQLRELQICFDDGAGEQQAGACCLCGGGLAARAAGGDGGAIAAPEIQLVAAAQFDIAVALERTRDWIGIQAVLAVALPRRIGSGIETRHLRGPRAFDIGIGGGNARGGIDQLRTVGERLGDQRIQLRIAVAFPPVRRWPFAGLRAQTFPCGERIDVADFLLAADAAVIRAAGENEQQRGGEQASRPEMRRPRTRIYRHVLFSLTTSPPACAISLRSSSLN
ncbi:conserved hypothetical protein [Ricinus communis]|uniref:Uncharacterized protein n=1 Tax=Ricinus communis TaxID=3988 RepID=B9TD37_RICCO|nr:conserved hypothetical protein [Ricinus communis]